MSETYSLCAWRTLCFNIWPSIGSRIEINIAQLNAHIDNIAPEA